MNNVRTLRPAYSSIHGWMHHVHAVDVATTRTESMSYCRPYSCVGTRSKVNDNRCSRPRVMEVPLEFANQAFVELLSADGLIILARCVIAL